MTAASNTLDPSASRPGGSQSDVDPVTTGMVMARYLAQAGITYVFGYPGDPNIELMEQCRRAGLEFVLTRREGTAAFMADAFGQLTALPGVCLSTLGPGSTNLVNGVATALLDRTPMLAISGQMSTRLEPLFTHQYVDHGRLFSSISKWATPIVPEAAGSIMRKALRIATAERPGPVHITTAANVLDLAASDREIRIPPLAAAEATATFAVAGHPTPPAALLGGARRPVILAGIAAVRSGCGPAVCALAEELGCPVVVSPKAKGLCPDDHPYYAGTIDMACNKKVWSFLASADLILAVGFDAVELIKPWQLTVPVVHIDTTANTDQVYPAEVEFVGALPAVLDEFRAAARGGPRWTETEVGQHRTELFDEYYSGRVSGALNPSDVVDAVRQAMPAATIATTDVGSHKLLVGQGWRTAEPRSLLMTNGLSSMGFALPAATTAKLLHRTRPVVCFTGDGGFAMVQSELQVAASLKLGLLVVVFCDNSLHRIELKQMVKHYPSWGTRFDASDIVKLAEAMGCDGERAETPAELVAILARAADLTGPLVIAAHIDPTQYVAQF
ncbi:MAG: thiamine pyrophosphate-binding protein [Vicinamibacterales bacterium]